MNQTCDTGEMFQVKGVLLVVGHITNVVYTVQLFIGFELCVELETTGDTLGRLFTSEIDVNSFCLCCNSIIFLIKRFVVVLIRYKAILLIVCLQSPFKLLDCLT